MNSMTGYGRASLERDGRQLTIEVKSVNHRFLDLSFRMPRSFSYLEEDARKRIGERLARGHVDVFATYRNLRSDAKQVKVDEALLAAYQRALDEVEKKTGTRDDRTLMSLARLTDVLVVTEADEDQDALRALFLDALDVALEALRQMRGREGAHLKEDLLERAKELEMLKEEIQKRYPETVVAYAEKLKDRVRELLSCATLDEQRVAQEVALMADRSDISEELVRLKSHIAQLREIVDEKEPAGRKLDFIVQELNREVNTISSKSQDVPITRLAVTAKAEIEKMREQVQNIE